MKIVNHKLFSSEKWIVPAILLGVCIAAYGLQIPWLGYTLDDWIILHSYSTGGVKGLMEYSFMGSRPLVFWIWELGFLLVGKAPLGWHIFTLTWRFLTVWMFWVLLREFWPTQTRRTTLTAALFAVYPIFFQQPSALTFSFHWVCHFLVLLSLYWMVRALRCPKQWLAYSTGAILAGSAALFSQEFFVGYELLRPILIIIIINEGSNWNKNLRQVIRQWAPYALLFAGYLIWRLVAMPVPGADRNTPQMLSDLFHHPFSTLPSFLVMVLRAIVNGFVGVWYQTYDPKLLAISPMSGLISWGLVALVFGVTIILFLRNRFLKGDNETHDDFSRWAIWIGLAVMLVGFIPGWSIGRSMTATNSLYNDRFGLAAMAGVSLIVVGIVETLVKQWRASTVIILAMVSLAVGAHFRNTTEYRWSWEQQTRLYWQLKWRAPKLEAPTAIYGDGALVKYIGSWATISAINEIYGQTVNTNVEPYWYFDLTKVDVPSRIMNPEPILDTKNNLSYRGTIDQSLVIQADALPVQCLWVVSLQDKNNPYLTIEAHDALPISSLERILPDDGSTLDPAIFGPEISHDWCYYYEKAALAHQHQDWAEVMRLWHEAQSRGFSPNNEPEYMIFIEASAYQGDWNLAQELTKKAYYPYYVMHDYICTTWRRIQDNTIGIDGQIDAIRNITVNFDCQEFLH